MIDFLIFLETLGLTSIPVSLFFIMFIKVTPKKRTSPTIGDSSQ